MLNKYIISVLILLSHGFPRNARFEKTLSCQEEEIQIYVNIPEKRNCILVFFIPSMGYMDGRGIQNVSGQKVFERWKNFFLAKGFSTLQFDKPGTGKSSGRLNDFTEDIIYCLFQQLETIVPNYSHKISFLTFESGALYLQRSWDALYKHSRSERLISVISLNYPMSVSLKWDSSWVPIVHLVSSEKSNQEKLLESKWAYSKVDSNLYRAFNLENNCILMSENCETISPQVEQFETTILKIHKGQFTWVENLVVEERNQTINSSKTREINLEKLY